jgi:hypothetical protein
MQNTMSEYKAWLDDSDVAAPIMQAYEKACAKLQAITPFEKDLVGTDYHCLFFC